MMSDLNFEKLTLTPLSTDNILTGFLLERICRDFNLKDLYRVARVCKSWKAIARRELQNRGVQRLVLHQTSHSANLKILNQLRTEPYIALLFIQQDYDSEDPREMAVRTEFINKFPEMMMIIGANNVYLEKHFNAETDVYNERRCFRLFNPWEISCLIIPKHQNMNVKYVSYTLEQMKEKSVSHNTIVGKLMPNNKEAKTIFLFFTFFSDQKFLKRMLDCIRQKLKKNNFVVWGTEMLFFPFINNCKEGVVDENKQDSFLGISISSANIDCFSAVFPCEELKISEFFNDLVKFKDKVKLQKHSIALITGPVFEDYYENSSDEEGMRQMRVQFDEFYTEDYEREYLYHFKKVFPEVPFISTFHNNMFSSFGVNMMDDSKQDLMHKEAISILIITFR